MGDPYIAKKETYLINEEGKTVTVFHPAIKMPGEDVYCYFPDEGTTSGLVEHHNEEDALANAKELYHHYNY